MTSRDFVYWLQGFFELHEIHSGLSVKQAEIVKGHLKLVFKHEIDPSYGDQKHLDELNNIHKEANDKILHDQIDQFKLNRTGPNGELYRC